MSLLLDALQRASKDKERVALAAAQATANDAASGPPTQPSELTLLEPIAARGPSQELELELTPKPPPATPPEATQAVEQPPAAPEPEPAPVNVPPPLAVTQPDPPSQITATPEARVPAPTEEPTASPAPGIATPTGATAASKANPAPSAPLKDLATAAGVRPIAPANAQAAANAIRKGYAKAPSTNAARRRVLILGGVAACIALGLGSFLLGLWGDPERLLGLSGNSSLSSGSALPPAPLSAASSVAAPASAPVETVVETAPPPVTPVSSPASSPASAPAAVAASAATTQTAHRTGRATKPSKGATSPVAPKGPVFSTKLTAQGQLEQGYTALVAGRLDDAAQAYNAALASNPLETDALLGLAYVAHSKGRREEAQALYAKVLRIDPGNSIANAGLIALDAGTNAGATKGDRAKALAASQPDSAAAQAQAANALAQEGLVAEAALAYGRAHALEPSNPWHSYNLAVALDKLGNYAQAVEQYDKAVQNASRTPTPLGAQRIQSVRTRLIQLRQLLDPESDGTK